MSVVDFSVAIPNGTQIAAQLLGFAGRLEASMFGAMTDIADQLHQDSVTFMNWQNPTGNLESTAYEVITPWQAIMGYAAPYALRRELGFSGLTDSLGRYYPHDPGKYYLQQAFRGNKGFIEGRVGQAVQLAMNPLGIP